MVPRLGRNIGFVCRFVELISSPSIFTDVKIGEGKLPPFSKSLEEACPDSTIDETWKFGIPIPVGVIGFSVTIVPIDG